MIDKLDNMLNKLDNDDLGKLVLRLSVGLLLLFHGVHKIMNHKGTMDYLASSLANIGLPSFISYGVYIGELIAPVMIIVGLLSRLGGLLVVIFMLFAILLAHTGDILSLTEHGAWKLELQAFFLFGGLAVAFLGSGKFAVKPD